MGMETVQIKLPGVDDDFIQEAYKVLRTNLRFCGQDYKTVMITSCEANEGKTTVTLSLAKSLADEGKRVLVVDTDMRKSVMAGRNATIKNPKGLSEMLTGMSTLGECVYHTNFKGMDVMFAGKYPPNPVELLGGKNFATMIDVVRGHYDYVLVDTAPLGAVIDAAVVSQVCDGVILVIADECARYSQVREVLAQLSKGGSKVLGVVRNQSKKSSQKNRGKYYHYGKYSNS